MTIHPQPHEVRRLVSRIFESIIATPVDPNHVDENILIDEGRYVARSYRIEGLLAMWLVDVGIVQFYDDDGEMLRTVNLLEEGVPHRMAA